VITVTFNKCKIFDDRLHLNMVCHNRFKNCWSRAVCDVGKLKAITEVPGVMIVNKHLIDPLLEKESASAEDPKV